MKKHVYIRARDGKPVSEDEACDASGALKDGYAYSVSLLMKDSAGNAINVQDAIDQVPWHLGSKLRRVLADLQSDWVNTRDDAILNGHSIGASLKSIADGQSDRHLVTDASRSACAVAAEHLYAEMAKARAKAGAALNDEWAGIAEKAGLKRKGADHG